MSIRASLRLCAVTIASLAALDSARADEVIVCDLKKSAVQRLDAKTGEFIGYLVRPGDGQIFRPHGITFGPDGDVYLANWGTDNVTRYDGNTGVYIGEFVTVQSGGLRGPTDVVFGPDGHLYVASFKNSNIVRYDGQTGAFIDIFVPEGSGGLYRPELIAFGPDGHLYVTSMRTHEILRYDGVTGTFMGPFIPAEYGGIYTPHAFLFSPDGYFYVASFETDSVQRFDALTGEFIDEFIPPGLGGLSRPHGMMIGPNGDFYVTSFGTGDILRYDGETGAFRGIGYAAAGTGMQGPTVALLVPNRGPRMMPLTPARAGESNRLRVTEVEPGRKAYFIAGLEPGLRIPSGCNVYIELASPTLVGHAKADADGVATLFAHIPARFSGRTIYTQALIPSNCTISNPRKELLE